MLMKTLSVILLLFIYSLKGFAQIETNSDVVPIHKVLSSFMRSIITKDTTTLSSLFATNVPIGWTQVQSKATLDFARKTNPAAAMVEKDTHKNFINYVGKTKDAVEEKFYNIKIRQDGLLASVSFDYSFWANGKKENWGQENWELVHDGNDWKIAGIYYSYIMESVSKEPNRITGSN